MQQAEGGEAILWSRSHNTVSLWALAQTPIGLFQQTYKVDTHVLNQHFYHFIWAFLFSSFQESVRKTWTYGQGIMYGLIFFKKDHFRF